MLSAVLVSCRSTGRADVEVKNELSFVGRHSECHGDVVGQRLADTTLRRRRQMSVYIRVDWTLLLLKYSAAGDLRWSCGSLA